MLANEVLLHANHHGPASAVGEELDADRAFLVPLGDHQKFAQLNAGELAYVELSLSLLQVLGQQIQHQIVTCFFLERWLRRRR